MNTKIYWTENGGWTVERNHFERYFGMNKEAAIECLKRLEAEEASNANRMVAKSDGRIFIETKLEDWFVRDEAWRKDTSLPCPMPLGHMMFETPEVYGCVYVK
jgi:hypothetical protein